MTATSRSEAAPALEARDVTKVFHHVLRGARRDGGDGVRGARRREPLRRARRDRGPGRRERQRQEHVAAPLQSPRGRGPGLGAGRRRAGRVERSDRAAPPHRLRAAGRRPASPTGRSSATSGSFPSSWGGRSTAVTRAPPSCSSWSACRVATTDRATRASSRAASASASRSRARSPPIRPWCCSTSRSARSTPSRRLELHDEFLRLEDAPRQDLPAGDARPARSLPPRRSHRGDEERPRAPGGETRRARAPARGPLRRTAARAHDRWRSE